mmetsp:Transcript_59233/g.117359  ORF Transcript_59233/g.117359 Transcript_59233/m.117359 type:complete len:227 (-) Transcript_59233:127-807(-)
MSFACDDPELPMDSVAKLHQHPASSAVAAPCQHHGSQHREALQRCADLRRQGAPHHEVTHGPPNVDLRHQLAGQTLRHLAASASFSYLPYLPLRLLLSICEKVACFAAAAAAAVAETTAVVETAAAVRVVVHRVSQPMKDEWLWCLAAPLLGNYLALPPRLAQTQFHQHFPVHVLRHQLTSGCGLVKKSPAVGAAHPVLKAPWPESCTLCFCGRRHSWNSSGSKSS